MATHVMPLGQRYQVTLKKKVTTVFRVRVRVGVWNRVSVSKTVALLHFVTLRPSEASEITSSQNKALFTSWGLEKPDIDSTILQIKVLPVAWFSRA